MKKKELKKEVKQLQLALDIVKNEAEKAQGLYLHAQGAVQDWRYKYETLLHTPEYKADTEAAFNRGAYMTKQKFKAWLLEGANAIEVNEVTDEF